MAVAVDLGLSPVDRDSARVLNAVPSTVQCDNQLLPCGRSAAANTLTGSIRGADLSKLASSYPPKSRLQPRFCSCWNDCRV